MENRLGLISLLTKARGFLLIYSALASVIVLFLMIPLISLIAAAGADGIVDAFRSLAALKSVALSMEAGVAASSLSILFGVPLAYVLSRAEFPGKSLVEALLDLPLVLPHSVVGIAILLAFNSRAPIGAALSSIGLRVEDSLLGVVSAMAFVSAPFAVNFTRQGFENVDISLEQVARSLGAKPFRVFLTISLPLAARSIAVGWLMAFSRAISEMGAVMIVAYHPTVGSVLVYEWLTTRGLKPAASLSIILLLASLAVLGCLRVVKWRRLK